MIDSRTRKKYIEELARGVREHMGRIEDIYGDDENCSAEGCIEEINKALKKAEKQLMLLNKKYLGWRAENATETEILKANQPKLYPRIDQAAPELERFVDRIQAHVSGAKAACSDARVVLLAHRDSYRDRSKYKWQRYAYLSAFNHFEEHGAKFVREAALEIMVLLRLEIPTDDAIKKWRGKLIQDSKKETRGKASA